MGTECKSSAVKSVTWLGAILASLLAAGAPGALSAQDYARSGDAIRSLELGSGTVITMLVESSNLGSGELEMAEIVFPAGMPPGGPHEHASIEIFYVIEGVLGHVVDGELHRIEPGMVGVVKPGDSVAHQVLSDGPVRAVVVWAPGGEADRIAPPARWDPVGH